MRIILHLLFVTGTLFLLSCIQEEPIVASSGDDATIYLTVNSLTVNKTRGFGEADGADNEIEQLRILAFRSNGRLAYKQLTNISETSPFKIVIASGSYDFVFIGNEDYENNSSLSDQLDALVVGSATLSDIESLVLPAKAFGRSVRIPSSAMIKGVNIVGDSRYIVDGVEHTGIWKIPMKRLGVRFDLKVTTESIGKSSAFSELHIKNIPMNVHVLEQGASGNKLYNGGQGKYQSEPYVIKVEDGDNNGFVKPPGSDLYEWIVSRIILPSSVFTPDEEKNGLILEIHYNNGDVVSGVVETGLDGNYQVPRNTHFMVDANIEPTLEIYLNVQDWDNILSEVPVGMDRALNVSAFSAAITQGTRERIWFSSNMPDVEVEQNTSGNMAVNSVFKDLAGASATNITYVYDAVKGEGSGYIDIMASDKYSYGTADYYIYLNANGLRRQIKVKVTAGGSSTDKIGYFEYVGAFWRNNQVGERVISGASTGTWEAEVVSGRDWVVIGRGKSTDMTIYSNNPGDAEDFPVEGDEYIVGGVGEVYFRLGAKSKNPNPGKPRYGKVKISTYNKTNVAYIYLRQGEEADYLMRPDDYGTSKTGDVSWGTSTDPRPRPLAVKISPYNLTTVSSFNGGTSHSSMSVKGGKLTDFPTQAGTFFYWGQTGYTINTYHPVNPNISSINGWMSTAISNYWQDIMERQEGCPGEYRRPRSGPINNRESQPSVSTNFVRNSEISQSLWGDPSSLDGSAYSLYGYYADGFFDRRRINDITSNSNTNNPRSLVLPNQHGVGFVGCLFYNPYEDSNASIFFPAPGYRHHTTGALYASGRRGQYWTASKMNNSGHFINIFYSAGTTDLNPRAGTEVNLQQQTTSTGANIRCVKD